MNELLNSQDELLQEDSQKPKLSKEERIEKETAEVLSRAASGNVYTAPLEPDHFIE